MRDLPYVVVVFGRSPSDYPTTEIAWSMEDARNKASQYARAYRQSDVIVLKPCEVHSCEPDVPPVKVRIL